MLTKEHYWIARASCSLCADVKSIICKHRTWMIKNKVRTRVPKIGGANMETGLDINRGDEHTVRSKVRLACVGRSGRPQRLAAHISAALDEIAIAS